MLGTGMTGCSYTESAIPLSALFMELETPSAGERAWELGDRIRASGN